MINIDLGDLADKNSLLKRINNAFESARKSAEPSMIFFDEMDKVLPNVREDYYSDHSKAILAQLLTLIDGMNHNKNFILWRRATTTRTCRQHLCVPAESTRKYISVSPTTRHAWKYSDYTRGKPLVGLK